MSVNRYTTAGGLQTLANGQRIWIGTKEAHDQEKLAGTLPTNCLIAITNDDKELAAKDVSYDLTPVLKKLLKQEFPNKTDSEIDQLVTEILNEHDSIGVDNVQDALDQIYEFMHDTGTAATKDYTNTIEQNNRNLVTSGAVYSYVDTMITQALNASY